MADLGERNDETSSVGDPYMASVASTGRCHFLRVHTPLLRHAPRTRDGHPDLSGIWYAAEVGDIIDVSTFPPDLVKAAGLSVPTGAPVDDPCPKGNCITQEPFPTDGGNIARSLPGKALPYQPWARKAVLAHMLVGARWMNLRAPAYSDLA